ncbi:hypothetical protein [Parasphingorhabdus sp.]|uniref:hypothetical protein n=1 Tax=Parasphingorhabdus sp. TaxID=2709688 RepID=UPI003A8E9963
MTTARELRYTPLSRPSGEVQLAKSLIRVWAGRIHDFQLPRINWLNLNTGSTLLPVHNGPKTKNSFFDPQGRRYLAADEIERIGHTGYQGSTHMLSAVRQTIFVRKPRFEQNSLEEINTFVEE